MSGPTGSSRKTTCKRQISALRTAFGADRDLIRTVAGRGYQFTGEIRTVSAARSAGTAGVAAADAHASAAPPTNLPEPVSELIGRDAELARSWTSVASHRLVTLTGAGGIGKTRLGSRSRASCCRDLPMGCGSPSWRRSPIPTWSRSPSPRRSGSSSRRARHRRERVAQRARRSKRLLLVLDNCEHVIDAAARMAEALLRANPAARVIATSREPLRAEGEWVYPVPPLAVPAEGAADAMTCCATARFGCSSSGRARPRRTSRRTDA